MTASSGAPEPPRPIDSGVFRAAMGQFLTGVTVVAAVDPDTSRVHGMTANAFMSVSMEPALVVVSIGGATRSHGILHRCTCFGVSVLREGQERLALQLVGNQSIDENPQFVDQDAGPVLRDCLTSVCVDITSTVRAGDHTLVVGAVTRIAMTRPGARPLAYHRGRFVTTGAPTGEWPVDLLDVWAGSLRSGWG